MEWSFHVNNDEKYLAADSIARFAGNLKTAFRKAIGVTRDSTWKNSSRGGQKRNPMNFKHRDGGNRQNVDRSNELRDMVRRELKRAFQQTDMFR